MAQRQGDGHRLGAVHFVDGEDNITLYGVWEVNIKNEEDFIARGTVVCQEMGKEDSLKEEKGWHEEIMVEGTVCTYRSYNDLTETGYYERFVWEKGKGLIEYKSGFGAERDRIYLWRET